MSSTWVNGIPSVVTNLSPESTPINGSFQYQQAPIQFASTSFPVPPPGQTITIPGGSVYIGGYPSYAGSYTYTTTLSNPLPLGQALPEGRLVFPQEVPPQAAAPSAAPTAATTISTPKLTPASPQTPTVSSLNQAADSLATSDFFTLQRYIMLTSKDQELAVLLSALSLACKATARACNKAGIALLFGLAGETNATGDDQKKLDVLSNEIFINSLTNSGACAVLVSEENEEPIIVDPAHAGRFCVAFDPLDGSSNIDCNVSTGTIFGIYERKTTGLATVSDILRTGNDLIVAGYCMYGAATELVITFKNQGVHRFTLDPSLGEFIHTHANVKFPADGGKKIYSCNEGNSTNWDAAIKASVEYFKAGSKPYAARYVGSMVSDVHRTILYGGIYLYPADAKSKDGKLRVLYEGFPMAMIVEQAGGVASCGLFKGKIQRLLDLVPTSIHEKCPVILGGERDVQLVLGKYQELGLVQ